MVQELAGIDVSIQRDLETATQILKDGGCHSIFLFGSAARGSMHAGSDIDLAVRGCPPQQFFHLLGCLMVDLEHAVDLVDLDVPGPFVDALLKNGELVRLV